MKCIVGTQAWLTEWLHLTFISGTWSLASFLLTLELPPVLLGEVSPWVS